MSTTKLPPIESKSDSKKDERNSRARMQARAQLLNARKHKHASTIQSKFRGSRARVALLELKSRPRVPLWEGSITLADEEKRVRVEQRMAPEHLLRMITYTVLDTSPQLELSRVSKTAAALRAAEAQSTARRLVLNKNNELQLKGSLDNAQQDIGNDVSSEVAAEMREELGHVEMEAAMDMYERADDAEEMKDDANGNASETVKYTQTPFVNLKRVSLYVDSAEGLPLCCTATRVTALLLSPLSRELLGDKMEGFSAPESPAYSPTYNLKASWKSRDLRPYLTLLIRIDTLERPALAAKTIGYAALKLCVDSSGAQPNEQQQSGDAKLNAGRFKLPVMLGKLPKWGNLSEEEVEGMPQLPGAWLSVRLIDARASCNGPNGSINCNAVPARSDVGMSVALSLYLSYDRPDKVKQVTDVSTGLTSSSSSILPAPPLATSIGRDLRRGVTEDLDEEDMEHMHELMRGYIRDAFTLIGARISMVIDKRFLYHYNDSSGLLVGVDALYNLPVPSSSTAKSGLTLYKTTFQYLRGEGFGGKKSKGEPLGADDEEDPRYIVDDASTVIDFESSCRGCLVYLDDLQQVKGLRLGPEACLMVVVTKVFVYFDDIGSAVSSVSIPFNSPDNTYWGLLPLRCESPFLYPEDAASDEMEDGAFVNAGSHQIPLFQGLPPEDIVTSSDPFSALQQLLMAQIREKYSVGCSGCWSWLNSSEKDAAPAIHPTDSASLGASFSPSTISAVIRVQDGRLRRFCNHHIVADEAGADLNTDTMMSAISLIPGHSSLLDDYEYNSLRFEHLPRLKELLPPNIKPSSISSALNREYVKHIQKILDAT